MNPGPRGAPSDAKALSRPCAPAASRSDGKAGFTLIEILVALVVLGLGLGILLQIFSTGLGTAHLSRAYGEAALLAESRLTRVGVEEPVVPGESRGRFDSRFRWRLRIDPYAGEGEEDGVPIADAAPWRLYKVAVTVSWGRAGAERSVTLTTLKLGQASDG